MLVFQEFPDSVSTAPVLAGAIRLVSYGTLPRPAAHPVI
jgi:hypothetical protein